jgi:hypothetical protein
LRNRNKKIIGDNFYFHVAHIFKRELDNDQSTKRKPYRLK